jgi:dihydroxy-acid dehydratase
MEAGKVGNKKYDLVDAMVMAADEKISEKEISMVEQEACPTCGSCSGMFTANSMNCLNEAIGLALPGNGTIVATHKNRLALFEKAAKQIVKITHEYYFENNDKVLPRSIATREAFMNAMSLDIAMGGSTNTILHILAIAIEAGVDFTMKDIDALSRKIPVLCKVSPNSPIYHIEDVNRAGGILGILEQLANANLLDLGTYRADGHTLGDAIKKYTIAGGQMGPEAENIYRSAPAGIKNLRMGSQGVMFKELDIDREKGCIRSVENSYSKDGGLAVLFGNIASRGCVVKTAGVDESIFLFKGPAKVFESQDDAIEGILGNKVKSGDVGYHSLRRDQKEDLECRKCFILPHTLNQKDWEKACALVTDGRFSGGTSGLSIGHVSPEAAAGGEVGLVQDGDIIEINIPERSINVLISEDELARRKAAELARGDKAYTPKSRERYISKALKAYAKMVTSADTGAVREVE